jgi:hypothetical protein
MKVEKLETLGTWRMVADAARTTVGKGPCKFEPDCFWKTRILRAEHSPIRIIHLRWRWIDIPYWVSVHFVRHHVGIEHFVRSQRTDRTGVPRDKLPQNAEVTHECIANLQAMLSISKARLCSQASATTAEAWQMVLDAYHGEQPELVELCKPTCELYGVCTEFNPCGRLDGLREER